MSNEALNQSEEPKMKERVRWAITYLANNYSLTNEKIAKAMGCATSTVNSYRRMITLPGLDFLGYMASYGFNSEWFTLGKGEPFPGARIKFPEVCGPLEFVSICENTWDYSKLQPEFPADDFVFIRQIYGKISAGGGLQPDNAVDMRIAFRKDWITRKGKPENMSLIKVEGDSMEPTLLSGDLVLVDHRRNNVAAQGGIYAIAIDDEIMIKRVQPVFPDGKLLVISDNKQYNPFEIDTEKIKINGKVIWFAREMER